MCCRKGTIFAQTPKDGCANDASLLPAQFLGSRCTNSTCGYSIQELKVASEFIAKENNMLATVESLTNRGKMTSKELLHIEEEIDSNFTTHVFADLAHEQLAVIYNEKRRQADRRRVLKRRCEFHKNVFPDLNGAHAWALEACADALMEDHSKEGGRHVDATSCCIEKAAAMELYHEAYNVLLQMFGDKHEYSTDVRAKMDNIENSDRVSEI